MKDYREEFTKKTCAHKGCFLGAGKICDGIWKCVYWSTFLDQQNEAKDKVIEKQDELLNECIEFLYNDDLIDRISKRQ